MIKKGLFILFVITLLLITLWGFFGWSLANQSREQLNTFLSVNLHDAEMNSIDAQLLTYTPTLIGAKTSVKVSSKVEFIKEQIGDLLITARLFNGPVFYDDGKVFFGKALWKLSLDSSMRERELSTEHKLNTEDIIKSKKPSLSVLVDFNDDISYRSHIKKLATASLSIKDLLLEGNIKNNAKESRLNIHVKQISFLSDAGIIDIPALDVAFQLDQSLSAKQQHLSYLSEPFELKDTARKLHLTMASSGKIIQINNSLSGLLNIKFKNDIAPINRNSNLQIKLQNLSVAGYQALLQTEADILNLKQQIEWTLDNDAETPEGQDHIWRLYDQLETKNLPLAEVLAKKIFEDADSELSMMLNVEDLEKSLPPVLRQKLLKWVNDGLINQVDNHFRSKLQSKNDVLVINNIAMTWLELIKAFSLKGTK